MSKESLNTAEGFDSGNRFFVCVAAYCQFFSKGLDVLACAYAVDRRPNLPFSSSKEVHRENGQSGGKLPAWALRVSCRTIGVLQTAVL